MKIILTEHGDEVLFDDDDYEFLKRFRFTTWFGKGTERRPRVPLGKISIDAARLVLGNSEKNKLVDHIDGNPFNNQKSNLRFATPSQNMMNRRKISGNCLSVYKGVSKGKGRKKYFAQIFFGRRSIYLGSFENEKDAAIAYDKKAKELFGEFAVLNFSDGDL